MMISFIIPAYNEQDFIAATIEQLYRSAKAAGVPYEIIIVAGCCTDATVETARILGPRVLEVELRHISAVRNAGAKVAKGDIFVFVDADTLIPEGTLAAALGAHAAGAIGGGARTIVYGALSWPARLLMCVMSRILFWLRLTLGGFLWVDRGSFEAVGGSSELGYAAVRTKPTPNTSLAAAQTGGSSCILRLSSYSNGSVTGCDLHDLAEREILVVGTGLDSQSVSRICGIVSLGDSVVGGQLRSKLYAPMRAVNINIRT